MRFANEAAGRRRHSGDTNDAVTGIRNRSMRRRINRAEVGGFDAASASLGLDPQSSEAVTLLGIARARYERGIRLAGRLLRRSKRNRA